MPRFSGPLKVEKVIVQVKKKFLWLIPYKGYDQYWRVLEDFKLIFDDGSWILIKAGFCTDFASTPQVIWSIMPPDDLWAQSAVVHDFLYRFKGVLPEGSFFVKGTFTRKECDKIFYIGNKILGVPIAKNRLAYRALRVAGWYAWSCGKDKYNT